MSAIIETPPAEHRERQFEEIDTVPPGAKKAYRVRYSSSNERVPNGD